MDRFGTNDQGYFISRKDILEWVHKTLKLQLTHIEQLGSGAIYCQLLDSLYPGRVPLSRVNWRAKVEHESLHNFKLLQGVMDRLGIDKKIDIDKLAKCKYQDNLETIQWLKRYIELNGGPDESYNPAARRGNVQIELPMTNIKFKQSNKENTLKRALASIPTPNKLTTRKSSMLSLGHTTNRRSFCSSDNLRNMGSLKRTPSKPTIADISLQLRSPQVSNSKRQPLTVRNEQTDKLHRIFSIISEKSDEKVMIKKIREVFAFQGIREEQEHDIV